MSHVLSFAVAPMMAVGFTFWPAARTGHAGYGLQDGVIIFSAVAWTTGFTQLAKGRVSRQRPGYHYGMGGATEFGEGSEQENLSFFSGDTSLAFSLIASAATVAYLRRYPTAPYLAWWGGGVAALTGVLRIAADVHWATDVLVGAAAGTGVGVALPLLFHSPIGTDSARVLPLPVRNGVGVALQWPVQ